MSKFIDNFKSFIGMNEEEDIDEEYPQDAPASRPSFSASREREERREDRKFDITATARLSVVLVRPEVFADTKQIADHLNDKKTVVLNLEATSPEVTRRIIDFIGGVAYANNGNIKPVANNTFIIFPYNVNFVGEDLAAELENNGVVF